MNNLNSLKNQRQKSVRLAIGNTLGEFRNTVTRGIVSGINISSRRYCKTQDQPRRRGNGKGGGVGGEKIRLFQGYNH